MARLLRGVRRRLPGNWNATEIGNRCCRPLSIAQLLEPLDTSEGQQFQHHNNHCKEKMSSWRKFLTDGKGGVHSVTLDSAANRLYMRWMDGHKSSFPLTWLLDHRPEAYDPHTKQRLPYIDSGLKNLTATIHSAYASSTHLHLQLEADAVTSPSSHFPLPWLREHCTSPAARIARDAHIASHCGRAPVLWGNELFSFSSPSQQPPIGNYSEIIEGRQGISWVAEMLHDYGLVLVKGCPPTMDAAELLAKKLGVVQHTLYGGMWATNAEGDEVVHADSAYSSDGIPLHTDCAYMAEPPGLQMFSCVVASTCGGGRSLFLDGFALAERLRQEDPDAFEFLTTTSIPYVYVDSEHELRAAGPIIQLGKHGTVRQIRFNDSDRAPLGGDLSNEEIDKFYTAHAAVHKILNDPSCVLAHVLAPGEMVLVDNHRVLHGREPFQGRRRLVGCYISRDDIDSLRRVTGIEVPPANT